MRSDSTAGKVLVGTSGWSYRHWAGRFYPPGMPQRLWLRHAVASFDTLEVNGTFYRLPADSMVRGWAAAAPADFTFAVKASRLITHSRRLREPEQPLRALLQRLAPLGGHLGPLLAQLPPQARRDDEVLQGFLEAAAVAGAPALALEFRHESWFQPAVYRLLERHQASFVISDLAGRLWPLVVTAPLVYVRLHGPVHAYAGSYSDDQLRSWESRIREWAAGGHDVRVYFDNDELGYAAADALRLQTLLAGDAGER
jgi:uncharacterized protein YecE (DUF72 family)